MTASHAEMLASNNNNKTNKSHNSANIEIRMLVSANNEFCKTKSCRHNRCFDTITKADSFFWMFTQKNKSCGEKCKRPKQLIKTNLFVNTAIETSKRPERERAHTLTYFLAFSFDCTVRHVLQRACRPLLCKEYVTNEVRNTQATEEGKNKALRIFIIQSTYYDDPQQANHIWMCLHVICAHFIRLRIVTASDFEEWKENNINNISLYNILRVRRQLYGDVFAMNRVILAHFTTQCNYGNAKKLKAKWEYTRNFILRNGPFQQHSIDAIIASSLKNLKRSFLLI